MSQKGFIQSIGIMPEHCSCGLVDATAIRRACDEFFKRRGMDIYGRRFEYGDQSGKPQPQKDMEETHP